MRLFALSVVFGATELVLLLILADHTSWKFALFEILASGLLGAGVIRYVSSRYGQRVVAKLAANEFPGDTLADGAILFVAGVLLVFPGVMGDMAGLLLLIPWVRGLGVAWLRRRCEVRADAFRAQFVDSHLLEDPADGDIIIDGRIADDSQTDNRQEGGETS